MAGRELFIILGLLMVFISFYGASTASSQTISTKNSIVRNLSTLKIDINKNIGGTWQINYDESDNPLEKIQKTIEEKENLEPDTAANGEQSQNLPTVSVSLFPPETLSLEIGNGTLINEELKGITQTRLIYADGVNRSFNLGAGANISVTAAYKGNELTIETVSPRGNKMTEVYALSPDGEKLSVALRIANPDSREIIALNRVYDRVAANPFAGDGEVQ